MGAMCGPWGGTNFGTVIRRAVQLFSDQVALEGEGFTLTYAMLEQRTQRLAGVLHDLGVRAGERVLLMVPNDYRFTECVLAILRCGAVVVPVNIRLGDDAMRFIAADSGAVVLIAHADVAEKARAVRHRSCGIRSSLAIGYREAGIPEYDDVVAGAPLGQPVAETAPDDVAIQMYTSGSTGRPKGCLLSHAGHWWQARSSARTMLLDERDTALVVGPLSHANALWSCLLPMLYTGGRVALLSGFRPPSVLQAIEQYRPTFTAGTPAMFKMLLAAPDLATYDLSSLQFVICGSAPVPQELMEAMANRFGCEVVEGYGLTEGGANVMTPRWGIKKRGSAGLPVPDVELRVVAVDGPSRDCQPEEVGELWSRSPANALAYFNRPEATAEKFTPDGWIRTGDLVRRDSDGYVYIVGRLDDMINCGGDNIYPKEVESVLLGHPGIDDVCVVGAPHRVKGSVPVAWIVPAPSHALAEDDVKQWFLDRGAPYAHPRRVFLVAELPVSSTNKVDRLRLAQETRQRLPGGFAG